MPEIPSTSQTKGIKILIRHVKWYSNDISCTKMCVWFVTNLLKQNCPAFYLINAMYILSISPELQSVSDLKRKMYHVLLAGKANLTFNFFVDVACPSGCAVSIPISSEDEVKLCRLLVREAALRNHKIWPIFLVRWCWNGCYGGCYWSCPINSWNKSTNIYLLFILY